MESLVSRGQGQAPREWGVVPAAPDASSERLLVSVSLVTRGQSDMRGLVTAGRLFRLERDRVSRNERGRVRGGNSLLIELSRVTPRAATS